MPRKIDDVIVPDRTERRRTIRDIPIPQRSRGEERVEHRPPETKEIKRRSKFSRKKLWISLAVVLVALFLVGLSIFDGATLAYTPKSAPLSFNGDVYTARKTGNVFPYSVVKLSKEKSKVVPATGSADVIRKASGTIVVYNNTSAEVQKLVENTRFQTTEGKVYRIQTSVTVPGKKTQPGSVEVTVYADEPGEGYNIGLSDFTLPGLAGTPKFQTVYARSKTPMAGGFVGKESVVNPTDKAKAEAELKETLEVEMLMEAKAQVPEGFIMYASLVSVSFETLPTVGTDKDGAKITVRGDFAGVMFKETDLSNELIQSKLSVNKGEAIDVTPLESLRVSFTGNAPRDLVSLGEINLSVTGEATALWRTDEVALKTDLLGKHKQEISSILNNYPTITAATATLKPFWKKTFPSDAQSITIKKLPVK